MEYIKVSKAAEKWGISSRRVRVLCAEGKIPGVVRRGNLYMIPENASKPLDGRRASSGLHSKQMKNNMTINESKLKDEILIRIKQLNSKRLFSDFVERVKSGKIMNDGTDPLLSIIDRYVDERKNEKLRSVISKGTKLYRARVVTEKNIRDKSSGISCNGDQLIGFNETNSREPPLGCSTPGRNNISGATYLYLADSPETACSEIKPIVRELISLSEFETVDDINIIDFSTNRSFKVTEKYDVGALFSSIMLQFCVPVYDSDDYKATQIIADYLRKTGIDGISYASYLNNHGVNYSIFNSHRKRIQFNNSKIVILQSERKFFLDFNENKVFESETMGGTTYDERITDIMRNDILNEIKMRLDLQMF